jgi:shikimate dehydrogenase
MKRVGLIGFPLGHSISPVIQNVAFAHHGRVGRYELWETAPSQLEARLRGLRDDDVLGANVTVPYKEAVTPYLDELDAVAKETGAVNTIVSAAGRLTGSNTDVAGFARALAGAGFSAEGKRAVILGAGGAARAVGLLLARAGAASIDLSDLVSGRSEKLAEHLRSLAAVGATVGSYQPDEDAFRQRVVACDILVNCTPAGTRHSEVEGLLPIDAEMVPPKALVFDLVYNPPVTPLIAAAEARGAHTVGGLAMLVYQAAASFELWTGLEAPVELMLTEGRRALSAMANES